MTIRKKLSMGIGILLILFVALGIVTYFQIGQLDENLAEIIQGKELGRRVALNYRQYKKLDQTVTQKRDEQNSLLITTAENFEKIDNIIGENVRSKIDLNGPEGNEKIIETSRMEASIEKVAAWLGFYLQTPEKIYKKHIFNSADIFEQELKKFNNLHPNENQKDNITKLETVFNQTMTLIKEILVLNDYLQENATEHKDTRAKIDNLLDEEFEVFTRTNLMNARNAGRKMVGTAVIVTLILVLTGFLDVFVFGAAISRSITKPIMKLKDAMTEIGRGDFDAKIDIESIDEIGQLAACFNKMTEYLKRTTTSIAKLNAEITRRKKTQETLQKTQNELEERVEQRTAELARANKGLESAVWELRRVNKELKEFAYVTAHDLKTPLRGIGTLANWISKDYAEKFDEQGKEQARLLVRKAKQMSSLIDDILEYSRLGHSSPKKQPVDLNTMLSEIIASIEAPENIEITVENELPVLMCEKTHIIQVFQNLLSNAVKYMDKPEGRIKVGCVEQDGFWKFSVVDNGPGIEKNYHKKIFKLFQTLSSRDRADSTGIGLSIVKKLVEINSGGVWVESESGQGSTFFFTLPKSEIHQEVSAVSTAEYT